MLLTDQLFLRHPVLLTARRDLQRELSHGALTLDELVVTARRPIRTATIILDDMLRNGEVVAESGLFSMSSGQATRRETSLRTRHFEDAVDPDLAMEYRTLASGREDPVLIWSQRRLVPWSAVERAGLIHHYAASAREIIFFGDDDFVAPLVAAIMPKAEIHVVDLDRDLLARAKDAATKLGVHLEAHHQDIAAFAEEGRGERADAVVSDPFPTADAGFERMFWVAANRVLKVDGLNISTISASHKPIGFERPALAALDDSGFVPLHLEANFGKYEIFDFEFSQFEHEFLDRTEAKPSISQTKSIFVSRKLDVANAGPSFTFDEWAQDMSTHYLTEQAGAERQSDLARERGGSVKPAPLATKVSTRTRGLDTRLILAETEREDFPVRPDARAWQTKLKALDLSHTGEDIEELVRLGQSQKLAGNGELARLGLTIRAIESWSRT